jgi:hypothetical protein
LLYLTFLISSFVVFGLESERMSVILMEGGIASPYPQELDEGVVDSRSVRQEETTARAEVVEEKELLLLWEARFRGYKEAK